MVAALADKSALPADWNYYPWTLRRGGSMPSEREAHVRIGVRAVELDLAMRAGDTTVAGLASELAGMLDGVSGGGPAATYFRRIATGEPDDRLAAQGAAAFRATAAPRVIALGAWLGAARIAALRKDVRWFESRASRATLSGLETNETLSPAARAAAGRIEREISAGAAADWTAISSLLSEIIRSF
jgi:hypothetical protein